VRYFRCYQGEQRGVPRSGNDIWLTDDKNRFWICVAIQTNESMVTPPSDVRQVVVRCRHLAELAPLLSAEPD
jgi:hypothetical protein